MGSPLIAPARGFVGSKWAIFCEPTLRRTCFLLSCLAAGPPRSSSFLLSLLTRSACLPACVPTYLTDRHNNIAEAPFDSHLRQRFLNPLQQDERLRERSWPSPPVLSGARAPPLTAAAFEQWRLCSPLQAPHCQYRRRFDAQPLCLACSWRWSLRRRDQQLHQ